MKVRNLLFLLALNGNLDDEVIIFEQKNLYNGAEVISVEKNMDNEVIVKVKAFED